METIGISRDELAYALRVRQREAEIARKRALMLSTQGNDVAADHCQLVAATAEQFVEIIEKLLAVHGFDEQFVRSLKINETTIILFGLDFAIDNERISPFAN